mgnify:CR=1 FL=1
MRSDGSDIVFWGVLCLLGGLLLLVAPGVVWHVGAVFSLRTPAAVEPSRRQRAFWQVSGVVVTALGLLAIALSWWEQPGDAARAAAVILWVAAAGVVVMLVRAHRSTEDETELPPNEPSDMAYGFWTLLFSAIALMAVVGGGVAWSVPTSEEREDAWAEAADDAWGHVLVADAEQYTSEPEGAAVDPLASYVVIDSEAREPAQLWAAAERKGSDAVAALESSDLLLIADRDFRCEVDGAVVREVDGERSPEVQVAVVSHERSSLMPCLGESEPTSQGSGVLVTLDEPLGERRLVGIDGAGCTVERPGSTSAWVGEDVEIDHCLLGRWEEEFPGHPGSPFETLDDFEM